MRVVLIAVGLVAACLLPTAAEAQTEPGRWDFAAGPHVILREGSSDAHLGGGLTVARQRGRFAVVVETGGTRREGHNDWRALGGVRATLVDGARARVDAQAMAGTLIRQHEFDWAVAPGVGIDLRLSGRSALRFQVDAPIERADDRTASGVRASVWLALFSQGL